MTSVPRLVLTAPAKSTLPLKAILLQEDNRAWHCLNPTAA